MRKKHNIGKWILAVVLIGFVGLVGAGGYILYDAWPEYQPVVFELGESISDEPAEYLIGPDWILDHTSVDISAVDTMKVGKYEIITRTLWFDSLYEVEVEDTTAPDLVLTEGPIYLEIQKEYELEKFVQSVSDLSGDVECHLVYAGEELDELSFDEVGTYTFSVTAVDASENVVTMELSCLVDTPPMYIGVADEYIEIGTEYNPLESVVAYDEVDGILTDQIRVGTLGFDSSVEGVYNIVYTVTDSYGFSTTEVAKVHVCTADDLKYYDERNYLTKDELAILCSVDHFSYEPLQEADADAAIALIEPTLVDFKRNYSNGGWTAGSGYVYKITPEYVYFLSAYHVLSKVNKDCDIMFFDGTVVNTSFSYVDDLDGRCDEIAMMRIETSLVPENVLLRLKTICIDYDIYEQDLLGQKCVVFAKNFRGERSDKIVRPTLVDFADNYTGDSRNRDIYVKATLGVKAGMSGTAMVDNRGYLLGTVIFTNYQYDYYDRIDKIPLLESLLEASE